MFEIFCLVKAFILFLFIYCGFSFLKLLFRNTIALTLFSKRQNLRQFGNWAVITGASDGIGKALSKCLAKDEMNVVLISRSKDKLENVKEEILEKYKVEVKIICCDYTKDDIYDKIEAELKDLDVGILINNVGMSLEHPDFLSSDKITSEGFTNIIHCNCLSVVMMSRLILRSTNMLKKGGFIVNISSGAGKIKVPLLSVYSASKGFVDVFSAAMNTELSRSSKVFMQTIAPFVVSTKMSKTKPGLGTPTADEYANSVLDRLGVSKYSHGCFMHELQGWMLDFMPTCLKNRIMFSSLLSIRAKALKKLAKKE